MNYEELVGLWKAQRALYQEWERKLLAGPTLLRDTIERMLSPANLTWKEHGTNMPNRYVEVIDFYKHEKPRRSSPKDDAITPKGVLVFGIGVTFDYGVSAYPKNDIYIPVAVRLSKIGFEFALFSRDLDSVDSEWTSELEWFSKKLIQRYRDYLSHDPNNGFDNKIRMGFV